jgi:mercuric ion transport protein
MARDEQAPQDTGPQRDWKRVLRLGLAIVTCPCHVPVLVGILAGTALGGWLQQHLLVAFLAMSGVFVLTLLYGLQYHEQPLSGARSVRKR